MCHVLYEWIIIAKIQIYFFCFSVVQLSNKHVNDWDFAIIHNVGNFQKKTRNFSLSYILIVHPTVQEWFFWPSTKILLYKKWLKMASCYLFINLTLRLWNVFQCSISYVIKIMEHFHKRSRVCKKAFFVTNTYSKIRKKIWEVAKLLFSN